MVFQNWHQDSLFPISIVINNHYKKNKLQEQNHKQNIIFVAASDKYKMQNLLLKLQQAAKGLRQPSVCKCLEEIKYTFCLETHYSQYKP